MSQRTLGTFLGVYTPTILTILGVIMYLRFGWLVGHLGLSRVLLVVLLANAITLLTTLSFSAVATNTRVGGGGAYFMISRSLGIELGGAIGVPLFLSQCFSVTLYAYGLAESLRFVWPELHLPLATLVIVLVAAGLAVAGADHALKAQLPLLGLVALSLLVLAAGSALRDGAGLAAAAAASGQVGFWEGFAIFFPAVTGVMAGLGLSGDLREPGRSIPRGSLAAMLTGCAVYLVVPVLLAQGASVEALREDPLVWTRIAVFGPALVLPGLWAAIFSSAVGSILAAPRTLQAMARDGLAPRALGPSTGAWTDLLPGLVVSVALALGAILLGALNAVAAVVSMAFLTVYGTVNFVAAFEALSGDPSWRPRLRLPWPLHLLGGLACLAVMFLISPLAGALALVAELALWLLLSRREATAQWGDARRGLYESLVRWALVRLAHRPMSARNWRPHVLVFVGDARRELELVRFGSAFSQERGVVTVCQLVVGDLLEEPVDFGAAREGMQRALDEQGLSVFAEVDVVRDLVDGIVDVAQANGMAGLSSNTLLLGWPSDPKLQVAFLQAMRRLEKLNKSLLLGRLHPRSSPAAASGERVVHVWWGGLERNGDLMLLLSYLLTRNPLWRRARVEVLSLASTELMQRQTTRHLERLLPSLRLEASSRVILLPKGRSVAELIQEQSREAEVVLLGLATPPPGEEAEYARRLDSLAGELPCVFFVKNASLFIGELLDEPATEAPAPPAPEAKG